MFDTIFLDQLSRGVPQNFQAKFLKYAMIVGVDKLAKKGLMSPFDFKAIKSFVQSIKRQGRIELDDSRNSIKREIQSLKQEINNLAKNLENKKSIVGNDQSQLDILPRSSSTKRPKQQRKEDSRKRASSFDYKKTQEKRGHEITPKVTEVYPQQPNQIFQNFNINISKHHLDDTQIKEIFQNQSKLNETSEQKRLQSRPLKHKQSVVNKNFSNLSINYRNKENRPQMQMPDPQRVKELYEQQLKEQVQNKSLAASQTGYMNLSRNVDTSLNVSRNEKQERRDSKRKSQQKKIQYDPHAQINDLPYKQVQPQSKVKEEIEKAKRNHKMLQEQMDQQSNKSQRALRDVSDSILNTANFSKKQIPQEQYQLRQSQFPARQDTFYKSTVTLNEDYLNDQEYPDTEENDQDQQYENQYQDQYQQQEYEEEPEMIYNMAAPQIHSSSFSQQGTKRSQTKDEPQSQQKPIQQHQYQNGDFKSKERQSQSSQQISNLQSEYHSFYPNAQNQNQAIIQKIISKDQTKKQPQQNQDLSSQKMSAQLSAQQQSHVWERNSRQQRTNPFNQDDLNRSSQSSNFSIFNPDDDCKTFFQNDFMERNINNNQSSDLSSKQSMTSSSQQSEQALGRPMGAQSNGDERWFKKRSVESSQPDDIVRSNVFNNNRLSGTRGFNNSQF